MMQRAVVLFCVLIAGCSSASLSPPPVLILPDCPAPPAPSLPVLDAGAPLDSPANMAALLERDDALRAYIEGLLAALACFETQRRTDGTD